MTTCIVTLDGGGARLITRHGDAFALLTTMEHPEGRTKPRDIESDKPGRAFDSHGFARHSMERSESVHEHQMKSFVRAVAERLRRVRLEHEATQLVLIAAPHLLGLLRNELDTDTARLVYTSIPKDLQTVPLHDLWSHLRGKLPVQ